MAAARATFIFFGCATTQQKPGAARCVLPSAASGTRGIGAAAVGGGAFLFRKAVKQAFASHEVLEVKEPMFANVRGYQIAGSNYVAAAATQGAGVVVAEGGRA